MEYVTDNIGKHKVITKKNGVKTKILVEPSKWYLAKQKKNAKKEKEKLEQEKIALEREKKIKEKMREMAICELEEKGEI